VRLLSIDWDYFFPVLRDIDDTSFLYDWGHEENIPFMLDEIWYTRAGNFLRSGLPLPDTSGKEAVFWSRFRFSENATLFYGDSHSLIYSPQVSSSTTEVWNFDAHHDSYHKMSEIFKDGSGVVTCDNWATVLHVMRGVKIHTFYPEWASWMMEDKPCTEMKVQVDPGMPFRRVFDAVFLCRSAGWTPPWVEEKFYGFLESCPIKQRTLLDGMTKREFSMDKVYEANRQLRELMEAQERGTFKKAEA